MSKIADRPKAPSCCAAPSCLSVAALALIVIVSGGGCQKKAPSVAIIGEDMTEPSNEDLIEAVRQHLATSTYTEAAPAAAKVAQTQRVSHVCTQYDVDADPYAKQNPELARCPSVGATYWVNQIVYVDGPAQPPQTKSCETLPGPQYGWMVNKTADDTWVLTFANNTWDVKKISFLQTPPGAVQIKTYKFSIAAHQAC